jgi:hypothetical protein
MISSIIKIIKIIEMTAVLMVTGDEKEHIIMIVIIT